MAQLYADEDFSYPVIQHLRQLGHDILTPYEAGQAGKGITDTCAPPLLYPLAVSGLAHLKPHVAHATSHWTPTLSRDTGGRVEVVPDPTTRFPNQARLTHPQGVAGFTDEYWVTLAAMFRDTMGC